MTKQQLIDYWKEKAESYRDSVKYLPLPTHSMTLLVAEIFEDCARQLEKCTD